MHFEAWMATTNSSRSTSLPAATLTVLAVTISTLFTNFHLFLSALNSRNFDLILKMLSFFIWNEKTWGLGGLIHNKCELYILIIILCSLQYFKNRSVFECVNFLPNTKVHLSIYLSTYPQALPAPFWVCAQYLESFFDRLRLWLCVCGSGGSD